MLDKIKEALTGLWALIGHLQDGFLLSASNVRDSIELLEDVRLVPGMPADVMFLNDEQTLIGYLFDPFVNSMNRSFRE